MKLQAGTAWANSVSKDPERRATIVHTGDSSDMWDDALRDQTKNPVITNNISVVVSATPAEPLEYTSLLRTGNIDRLERAARINSRIGVALCMFVVVTGILGVTYVYLSHKS